MSAKLFFSAYFAILFCHFVLSFYSSKHQLVEIVKNKKSWPFFLFLVLLSASYPFYGLPNIILFFGVHHALNDTYLSLHNVKSNKKIGHFILSRFLFNLASYLVILRTIPPIWHIPVGLLEAFLLFSLFIFAYSAYYFRELFDKNQYKDLILFEAVNIVVVIGSLLFAWKITYVQFVFYHLFLWIFHPFWKMSGDQVHFNSKYLLASVVFTILFFLITPEAGLFPQITMEHHLNRQIYIWGAVHVNLTFALSRNNPHWIRSLFARSPARIMQS